ncbi:LysR family transcriptional regulator [Nonomuraea sediminis]|uniref:LysR family transcriptional regulator n=1 Tax=Nonomuraea sediminis TaxID=2835864 RepID=UPI0023E03A49|nr:LysR family transcriptional regulator [Nonomuraea sediminis]
MAYFAAVAEAGTVTEAARRLMIAQPELRLGVCLGVPDAVLRSAEALLGRVSIVQAGSAEQVELLSRGELAVGLVRLPVEDPGLVVWVVSDEPLGVVLAAGHPLARRTVLEWADLAGQRLLWFPAERAPGYAAQVLYAGVTAPGTVR